MILTITKQGDKNTGQMVGHCEHHLKNSTEFVKLLKEIKLDPDDIPVSFNF